MKKVLCLFLAFTLISVAHSQNVGIGTNTPGAKLEVTGGAKVSDSVFIGGQLRIVSGSPGLGKVLTSDANGIATWAAPSTREYAYIYNTSAQLITSGNAITFNTNGPMSSGITHNTGTSFIFINTTGLYKIEFSVSASQANQIAMSVGGGRYGSATAGQQNTGFVIVNIVAGSVILLNNSGSSGSIILVTNTGGTLEAVNASIIITQL
ncbi:hypothetical protein BH09BAC2_BH09BAC2_11800 [soil metagenome]